ncbi:MAG: hypothetical protein WKF87_06850 [Chryseolinea sp.]
MGRLVAITAKSQNGDNFVAPRVAYVSEDALGIKGSTRTGKGSQVIDKTHRFIVYERAVEIEAARNPSTTDIYVKSHIAVALAGAGTTQAGATPLTKYLNELLTIGAGASDAFVLPAATVGKVIVVINNDVAGDAAKIFPAVGQFHKGQAVNTSYSVPGFTRKHFVCMELGVWTAAVDNA